MMSNGFRDTANKPKPNSKSTICQFVVDVLSFSSQYTSNNGCARNLMGPPRCLNQYGDNCLAWCPSRYNREEYVEVKFEQEVYVEKVRIFENLNGGCVVKIDVLKDQAKYVCVWSRPRPDVKRSYQIFEVSLEAKTRFRTNQLKVYLDCTSLRYYAQIDAIEIIGCRNNLYLSDSNLKTHFLNLFQSGTLSDLQVVLEHQNQLIKTINLHKSMLLARCPSLLDYLEIRGNFIRYFGYDEFALITKFIYTSSFDVDSYEKIIERKRVEQPDKWQLIPNKFIRFSTRFNIEELGEFVLEHMVDKYLSMHTFASILNDSNELDELDCLLDQVELECLKFIKDNLKEAVLRGEFERFSKSILLKIVYNCI